ncbi:MAG: hypothetical protein ACWA49_04850 [Ruegeria sp.]
MQFIQGEVMKTLGLILSLAVLAACDSTNTAATQPVEEPARSGSGVSVSGYARAGVSTNF